MKLHPLGRMFVASALGALVLGLATVVVHAQNTYLQNNLVSDIPGLAAHTDPNLVNPWGIAASPTSPFWVSDNGMDVSTLYNTPGVPQALVVSVSGAPTGVVFGGGAAGFHGDNFIFATESGTIAGWRNALGTTAEVLIDNSGSPGGPPHASYKGLAIASAGGNVNIYAANFAQNRIDAYSAPGTPAAILGTFTDPGLPANYAPFNIQAIGSSLFVTYAVVGAGGDDEPGAGNGIVDRYDFNGIFQARFATGGVLNSPWGLAQAPSNWGAFGNDLLVGNFGDGTINAFDFNTGTFLGVLRDDHGNPIVIDGLWGLRFGNGGNGGSPNTMYFAAGIDGEQHGLFGGITPVPEPSTYGVAGSLALAALCGIRKLRRRLGQPAAV